ncbi:MAG TPA: flagellar basal body P-ring formation chaperone FlgA [Dissulfurispiraceae bacterium]|nr:flagellar basal body P-ring formation chaperone FlgA [Dissulfurispiraceae bacterium]
MKIHNYIEMLIVLLGLCLCSPVLAGNDPLFDKVQKAVKENLASLISDKVELEELRIVRGAEYFGGASGGMNIQNIYMDGYSGRNKVIYAVYLKDNSSVRTANVVVEASYDVFEDVYVTARTISRGEVLTGDDYYAVRQKLSKLPVGAVTDKHEIDGKVLKSTVTDGVIIRSNFLASSSAIKRGQRVNILVEGDNIVISAKGVLRSDAAIGEAANVFCDLTKKEVSGILVSPTLVKVKI